MTIFSVSGLGQLVDVFRRKLVTNQTSKANSKIIFKYKLMTSMVILYITEMFAPFILFLSSFAHHLNNSSSSFEDDYKYP